MSNIVVILGPNNEGSKTRMKEVSEAAEKVGGIDLRFVDSEQSFDDIAEQCAGAVVILPAGHNKELVPLAEKIGTLKLVQTFSAGTDYLDKSALAELGVDVANNGGANAVAVAEHAIGLMFSTNRKLDVQIQSVKDGTWMAGVEGEIKRLALGARDNKLAMDELSGGTFTITNGGVFGSLLSTPILNAPQSGILGMHAIKDRPIAVDGEVVIRPMMYVALSYDHRLVDGQQSVLFLVRVKELVEDPTRLMLEV